ncbi:MAG: glycosyltransferase [Myxococcales bacterium]|nr:glycosyltransferase [Myxococcales bacterium]MCB9694248.1 glycosyltransferase [Alphaproteobacteria bacterium]
MAWTSIVMVVYLVILAFLSLNGMHRLWMLWAFRRRHAYAEVRPPAEWPMVTVQLPMFNEQHVARRLILAVGALRYPRDRLFVQVLDDSTDTTTDIARQAVDELVQSGVDAVLVHRTDRTGFKAGALDEGLATAKGDLIAVFDADFVPPPSFLEQVVPHFQDGVGMVQARWGHLNPDTSWLTGAQATLLDGHFVVEHTARHTAGRWFNFNGTAGIWRRQAIEDAGGWQHDTLTEDLDLSYRAQLAGWAFRYLHEVVAPAELPPDMPAFKTQQHRWAKGSIQTAVKLLGRIWRAPVPFPVKLEATAHLTANTSYPLVVLLSILLPFAVYARIEGGLSALLVVDAVLFVLAVFPFVLFYAAAIWHAGAGSRRQRLARLPVVLALGMGMAVSQTRAVLEGLFGEVGTFVRTPKVGDAAVVAYRAATRGLVGLELALAVYLTAALGYTMSQGYWASVPFLGLFAAGYGTVGLSSLRA